MHNRSKRYRAYEGKYVYVIYKFDTDYPIYIGCTTNIKRRMSEHFGSLRGTGFAKKISKRVRSRDYKVEVYDFSYCTNIGKKELEILESYITANWGAEISKPKVLSEAEIIRLGELKEELSNVTLKSYEEVLMEKQYPIKKI